MLNCSLEVFFGGVGIDKLQFLITCKFLYIFGHHNPGSGLDPDPDHYSAENAGSGSGSNEYRTDRKHWFQLADIIVDD